MNRTTKLAGLLFGLTQLIAVETAQATVTFDGTPQFSETSISFISGGFSFSTGLLHTVSDADFGASNGTNHLAYYADGGNHETFSMTNNSPFTLSNIDLGGSSNFGTAAQSLTITGYRSDNTTVTDQLSISPTSFQTYSLTNWTNLQSVRLGSLARGYVAVDNIVTTPIPEPETYAMFLAGLGLMGAIVRRRRAS